jgi:hypothetical protein
MRFMVIVKATKETEAGEMPSEKLLTEMGRFNEELVKAGVMLAGEGLHPTSKGGPREVLREQSNGNQWAVRRGEGPDRRLLAVEGEIEGGGDRVGEALPQSHRGRGGDRDSAGIRGGGLRGRAHSRLRAQTSAKK